jgi:hypothetical protein
MQEMKSELKSDIADVKNALKYHTRQPAYAMQQ